MQGLPGDAACWREDGFPPVEERLCQLIERHDVWSRALFEAQVGQKEIRVPGEVKIPRPGDKKPEPKVTTDVNAIAQWFGGGYLKAG